MAELVRITKEFKFETGHALFGHDGLCKNIHGHGYKLSVSLIGTPILDPSNVKSGMVIDFSDLKKIKRVQYQPTSEMMIIDFAKKIKDELPKGLSLHHLILRETETCYVEWFASDQSP
jgi:6-pyruvoyltetrahydropterin/6-carboxytetrahydropterin synthase